MKLDDGNVFKPDVYFVSRERAGILTVQGTEGAPDLVAEVLSACRLAVGTREEAGCFPLTIAGASKDTSPMTWEEICEDPNLRDLPFKIETNQRGQIVISPARSRHGEYQYRVGTLLERLLPGGSILVECPIQTTAGVRVPDVAWTSPARRQPVIYTLAPEICVEVLSPYNDEEEMAEKRALYFAVGAVECWTCAEDGAMRFHSPAGPLTASEFCPGFPAHVEV